MIEVQNTEDGKGERIDFVGAFTRYENCFSFVAQDQFHRHLMLEAERKQLRTIIENKSRIILVHTTSGYKYDLSLSEAKFF